MSDNPQHTIALIGLGSIGLSFAALYLQHTNAFLRVYDPRPDLQEHVGSSLPVYLRSGIPMDEVLSSHGRLRFYSSLEEACNGATIVQEQGPEDPAVKRSTWSRVSNVVKADTHLWSSTSGIPASSQTLDAHVKTRLLVVHPFNPPHLMPLIEIVPSPDTIPSEVDFAKALFESMGSGHRPIVVQRELPGFVANRLAFVLFREACSLVADGTVTAQDLDAIVESSIGPRWAVAGPFKSYNYGGGLSGLPAFLKNLKGSIEQVWQTSANLTFNGTTYEPKDSSSTGPVEQREDLSTKSKEDWTDEIIRQTIESYGYPTLSSLDQRDEALRRMLDSRRILEAKKV